MMVKWLFDSSTSGPLVISTRSAFLAGGGIWAAVGLEQSRLPPVAVIVSVRTSLFIVIARTSERVGRCATFDLRWSTSAKLTDGRGPAEVGQLGGQGMRG